MRTRVLLVGTVLTVGAALAASPASAEPYPAGAPQLTGSTTIVGVGGEVVLNGAGYGANDDVAIDATYAEALGRLGRMAAAPVALTARIPVGTAQADAAGDWSASVTLTQVGIATIVATGSPSGVSQTFIVRVLSELPIEGGGGDGGGGGGDGDGLPITGTRLTTAVVLGTVAVITGAVLLWLPIALRRRGRHGGDVA